MRILCIAHSFSEDNMGAIRQRRIIRWLARNGFHVDVLTAGAPSQKDAGDDRVTLVPVAAADLTSAYRKLRRPAADRGSGPGIGGSRNIRFTAAINRWLMIPDKQAPWRGPAVRAGHTLIADRRPDLIFASLEPRTNLRVAAELCLRHRVPVVMEYRDLWTGSPYHHVTQPTPVHRWIHGRLERSTVRAATRVSAVSRGVADYLAKTYADVLRGPIALNYNFYDPEEYPSRQRGHSDPFVISYVGAMYYARQPRAFFEGLRQFIEQRQLSPEAILFRWVGSSFSIGDLEELIDQLKLRPYIDVRGQVPHDEALRLLVESDAAVIIQAPQDDIHVPGKLFEAMGARVPVVALSHPCEVTEIIERTGCGVIAGHAPETVRMAIERIWQQWRSGSRWPFVESECAIYSAQHAVNLLAQLFEETCRAKP